MRDLLEGKRILIVDDEPDIVENLEEILDRCIVESAANFREAEKLLKKREYAAAVLDIMGVEGYNLLDLATARGIPTVMLTAHAFSPDHLVRSLKAGARCYVPKWKIADIDLYLAEAMEAGEEGKPRGAAWFERLRPYFDEKFGQGWRKRHEDFWKGFVTKRQVGRRREDFRVRVHLERYGQLLQVGRIIVSEMDMERLFQVIMAQANRIMDTERSTVFLHDEGRSELWSLVATGMERNEIRIPSLHGVAGWVFANREPLIVNDAQKDERFYGGVDEKSGFRTANILCVPLINRTGVCIGVLQSLNKRSGEFTEDDRLLLVSISHYVTVAVENARLYEEVKQYTEKLERTLIRIETLENVKRHLTKFVPSSVARLAEQNPDALPFEKAPMQVSILFVDVQGFAKITEEYDPKLVNDMLERHFSRYLECIYVHDGEVNETSGDGLMAIFKDDGSRNHPSRAVSAGLDIITENNRLNEEGAYPWGRVELHLGINSGEALIGSTRMKSLAGERWTYTASGLVTVLASRIGNLSRNTQLFVGTETYKHVKGYCECEYLGLQELKNIREPIAVYRVKQVRTEPLLSPS